MKSKQWGIALVTLTLAALIGLGGITAFIDPFFHYHAPLKGLQYPIDEQRYQNDGIVRHFDYDALITGTSLTENFKASQFDELFDVHSVKVCASGGTFNELNNNLRRAIDANPDLRLVLFGLDSWFLFETPGAMRTDAEYPLYLYDDILINDVQYLLNKEVLCKRSIGVLENTVRGGVTTSFDEYSFWGSSEYGETGKAIALRNSPRAELCNEVQSFTEEKQLRLTNNLTENTIRLAQENPDIQFIYFFPPYSSIYWDYLIRAGEFNQQLDAWRLASKLLLAQDNIRLFSFYTDFGTVTNLDHYRDDVHYGDKINALLLDRMAAGEYELTLETYEAHWQEVEDFYLSYDYDALFSER